MPEVDFENEHVTAWKLANEIAWDSAVWLGQIGGLKSLVINPLDVLARWMPNVFPGLGAHVNGARSLVGGAEAFSKFPKIFSVDQDPSYVIVTDENKYQKKEVSYHFWAPITKATRITDLISSVCNLLNYVHPHHAFAWGKTLLSGVVALEGVARTGHFLYHLHSQNEKIAWQSIASFVMKVGLNILQVGLVAYRIMQLALPVVPAWVNQLEFYSVVIVTVVHPIAKHYWDNFAVKPLYEKKRSILL